MCWPKAVYSHEWRPDVSGLYNTVSNIIGPVPGTGDNWLVSEACPTVVLFKKKNDKMGIAKSEWQQMCAMPVWIELGMRDEVANVTCM